MSDKNRLESQLEDLFSDVPLPEPEAKPEKPPAAPAPPEPTPKRAAEAVVPAAPPVEQPSAPPAPAEPEIQKAERKTEFVPKTLKRARPGRRSGLRRTLTRAFLAVAILPTLLVSIFGITSQVTRIRSDVVNRLSLAATLQERYAEQWLEVEKLTLSSFGRDLGLQQRIRTLLTAETDSSERSLAYLTISARLGTFSVQHPEFVQVFILDSNGHVIVAADKTLEGVDMSSEPFFTLPFQEAISYYSPPATHPGHPQLTVVIAEPLRYVTNEPQGVLVGLVDPATGLSPAQEIPGLGRTGELYLLNQQGQLLIPIGDETTPALGDTLSSQGITSLREGTSGNAIYDNYAGKTVIGVYRWLPELQIGILAEQALSESYSSLFASSGIAIAVALVAVILTLVLSNQITSRIANPIVQMTESARQMVAGNLNQSVPVTRTDEIGTLGEAFNHMASQLRATITGLEEKIQERTQALQEANFQFQKRAIQLEASAEISKAATSILEPQELMQTTVDLIQQRFNLYHVSIFLLDDAHEWAVVRASTGEVGRQMMTQPHRLAVGGESMVGWVCANRQPRIALDVGADAVHFDHPLLPYTRSEMVLPLRVGDRLLGALDVQSIEEAAFDRDDIRTLQGMADLIAVALENARLFAETQQNMRRQNMLALISERSRYAGRVADILAMTVEDLGQTFDLEEAVICLGSEAELRAGENGHASSAGEEE